MARSGDFLRLLDGFLPMPSEEYTRKSAFTRTHARVLVAVMFFSVLLPLVALLALLLLYVVSGRDYHTGLGVTLAVLVGAVVLNMLLRALGSLLVAAIGYVVFYYLAVTAGVFLTGGWDSPVTLMLFTSPIITYLVCGHRYAMLSLFVVFMTGMLFLYMKVAGIECPQIMRAENLPYVRGVIWLLSSLVLALLFAVQHGLLDDKPPVR